MRFQLDHVVPGMLLDQKQDDAHYTGLIHGSDNVAFLETNDRLKKLNSPQLNLA